MCKTSGPEAENTSWSINSIWKLTARVFATLRDREDHATLKREKGFKMIVRKQKPESKLIAITGFFPSQNWHLGSDYARIASPDKLQTVISLKLLCSLSMTKWQQNKCLWTQLDRPTTKHSNKTSDAALDDEKTYFFSTKALSTVLLAKIYFD